MDQQHLIFLHFLHLLPCSSSLSSSNLHRLYPEKKNQIIKNPINHRSTHTCKLEHCLQPWQPPSIQLIHSCCLSLIISIVMTLCSFSSLLAISIQDSSTSFSYFSLLSLSLRQELCFQFSPFLSPFQNHEKRLFSNYYSYRKFPRKKWTLYSSSIQTQSPTTAKRGAKRFLLI